MTANTNLERRLADYYAEAAPMRAPDRVLVAALATIETTRQRRGMFAPWRFPNMSTYAKVAAAVAAIAVIAFGYWQLAPKQSSHGGMPSAGPPTNAPTASPAGTNGAYVPPPLAGTFTSVVHGLSVSYPAGWTPRAATDSWTRPGLFNFDDPAGDVIFDPTLTDHLFFAAGSQPLVETTFDEWWTGLLSAEGCESGGTVDVGGADGVIAADCDLAAASVGGRGYLFWLYIGDDPALAGFEGRPFFEEVLATVELHPEDASE